MASCPKCMGKLKRKNTKQPGGADTYKCERCKRKFVVDQVRGGLKPVSV